VHELGKLLRSRDAELANLARLSLEKMLDDDSRRISIAAEKLLAEFDRSRAPTDAGHVADSKPDKSPLSPERLIPVTGSVSAAGALPEKINTPLRSEPASDEQFFNNTFRAKWAGTVVLAVVSAILVIYYNRMVNDSTETTRALSGLAAGLTGLVQWSVFRNRLEFWWVPANMVTGFGLGAFNKYLYENTGWGVEDLLLLLAVWAVFNAVLGPRLMRGTHTDSKGWSMILESGTVPNVMRLLLIASLVVGSIANALIVLEKFDSLTPFWTLYGVTAILFGVTLLSNWEIPKNFGFITLAIYMLFDGFNVERLAFNNNYPLYYFTLNGIFALLAGTYWAFQKETWKSFSLILLCGGLIVIGVACFFVYDTTVNNAMLALSVLFSVPAAVALALRK
jgi:uncharacterized membrane protein HdeD (DUF308 family)